MMGGNQGYFFIFLFSKLISLNDPNFTGCQPESVDRKLLIEHHVSNQAVGSCAKALTCRLSPQVHVKNANHCRVLGINPA